MLISIIIPVYHNEESLNKLYTEILEQLNKFIKIKYEIIFVNDGSLDTSWNKIKKIIDSDKNVIGISLSKNFGQHPAIIAGLNEAKGDLILTINADLQDPTCLIYKIIKKLQDGFDIAIAIREYKKESFIKKITSFIHYKLIKLSYKNFPDNGFDCWGMNKKAFNAFMQFNDINRRNQSDIMDLGFKKAFIPYSKSERSFGKSQYNFFKLYDISISLLTSNAKWPLQISLLIGLTVFIFSILLTLILIIRYYIFGTQLNGWTSITILILFFNGLLFLMLGIYGEYISRIYSETKKRPLYFINEKYTKK